MGIVGWPDNSPLSGVLLCALELNSLASAFEDNLVKINRDGIFLLALGAECGAVDRLFLDFFRLLIKKN